MRKPFMNRIPPALQDIAGQFEGNRESTLLDTIRKYVMSVNPIVGENELQKITESLQDRIHRRGG